MSSILGFLKLCISKLGAGTRHNKQTHRRTTSSSIQPEGLGERCKLSQRVWAEPGRQKHFWCVLSQNQGIWWHKFQWLFWEITDQMLCVYLSKNPHKENPPIFHWAQAAPSAYMDRSPCLPYASVCLQARIWKNVGPKNEGQLTRTYRMGNKRRNEGAASVYRHIPSSSHSYTR